MEGQEEVIPIEPEEPAQIIKGKRTKRQRVLSPIPFAVVVNNFEEDYHGAYDSATEEEEDMANCLILLAQGQSRGEEVSYKFNSRRYIDAADGSSGKAAGYYVYECKTCSRTFPSFQALGGHRASHKKPKMVPAPDDVHRKKQFPFSDEEGFHLSLQPAGNRKASRVHECSICGAEFTSGQALGGHMRRHRGPIASTALSLCPISSMEPDESKKPKTSSLSLDLNLPAPEDHDVKDQSKFASVVNPSAMFLPAPAMVDCHN